VGHGQRALEGLGVSLWRGKRVLLTGHTGLKGAWAARWLARMGAEVTGLALPPEPGPNLFDILGTGHLAASHLADLRDADAVARIVAEAAPEVVLHLAAQPLVRLSYADPVLTFGSNVMGTVHLLDALNRYAAPRVVVVVTSDKVYANDGTGRAYAEGDRLGGHDPYSASKAATEVVVQSFRQAYFDAKAVPVVTARGGNVIGGGDFSADRLVPDLVRALAARVPLTLRNPQATRPWQHVLDCLAGYFRYAEALMAGETLPPALNFGPEAGGPPVTVKALAAELQRAMGAEVTYRQDQSAGPHEMPLLSIDPSLAIARLGWRPKLSAEATVALTAAWYGQWLTGGNAAAETDRQIALYQDQTP